MKKYLISNYPAQNKPTSTLESLKSSEPKRMSEIDVKEYTTKYYEPVKINGAFNMEVNRWLNMEVNRYIEYGIMIQYGIWYIEYGSK